MKLHRITVIAYIELTLNMFYISFNLAYASTFPYYYF